MNILSRKSYLACLTLMVMIAVSGTIARSQTLSSIKLNPSSVIGGSGSTGTISISKAAPSGGFAVSVTSSSRAATVPESVTVPAGSKSITFNATTSPVAAPTTVTLTGKSGTFKATASLKVNPPSLAALTLNPSTVIGGSSSIGTIRLSGAAPLGGTAIGIKSSTSSASVPSKVNVEAGATSVTFAITTKSVASKSTSTITVTLGTAKIGMPLTLTPLGITSLILNPDAVKGGSPSTATVTLSGPAPSGGVTCSIKCSNASASVPATITVPAGSDNTTFTVATQKASQAVTANITATSNGTSSSATLAIQPADSGGSGLANSAWPTARGDVSGTCRGKGFGASGDQKWFFSITPDTSGGADAATSPVIGSDGSIYYTASDGRLHAIASDGYELWHATIGLGGFSPVVSSDGTIYAPGLGAFYAFTKSGSEKWRFPLLTDPCKGCPTIAADGTIYVPTVNNFYAINPDGTQKWVQNLPNVSSSPALGTDGTIYMCTAEEVSRIVALNPNGSAKWSQKPGATLIGSPSVGSDGTIYALGYAGGIITSPTLYAVTAAGKSKWSCKLESSIEMTTSPCIGKDGTIYVRTMNGLAAVSPTGSKVWNINTNVLGSLQFDWPTLGSDGTVYIGPGGWTSQVHEVIAVSSSGAIKWRLPVGSPILGCPVIGSDGTLYVATELGLLAIK